MVETPDDRYLSEIQQIDFHPVFILGVHRSGTSILYSMLQATDSFNPVTAYHLVHYHELLSNHIQKTEEQSRIALTESLNIQGVQDRRIDRMMVTADFAEEYGFLLSKRTVSMHLSPKNVPLFIELCKKIQFIAGNTKPLLLKNPYDFSNFVFIKKMFPDAKFVFIHRHPLKTISSTLKAFKEIFRNYHPYMARLMNTYEKFFTIPLLRFPFRLGFIRVPEIGVMYIARTTEKASKYYLKNIRKLSRDDFIAITYEELCLHPQRTIEDILQRLQVQMTIPIDAATLMNPRTVDIDPTVQKYQSYIRRTMKGYCETFHYQV